MKKIFLVSLSILVTMVWMSCSKQGGGSCATPRTVYAPGIPIMLSFINDDSLNLLESGTLKASDIDIKYGNSPATTMLIYDGNHPSTLKYIAVMDADKVGDNQFTILINGDSHSLSFHKKLVPGGCAGPKSDLSDFKVDLQPVEPVVAPESLFLNNYTITTSLPKIYVLD